MDHLESHRIHSFNERTFFSGKVRQRYALRLKIPNGATDLHGANARGRAAITHGKTPA